MSTLSVVSKSVVGFMVVISVNVAMTTLSVVVCKSDVGFSVVVSINVVVTTLSVDISIVVVYTY
jgi:hypothetical protein